MTPINCSAFLQERMQLLEKLENRPLKVRCKEDQEKIIRSLSGPELEMLVDLRPFMQRNPFIVHADASLSRVYRLFRTMGLRHLFVCPPQPKVCQSRSHPGYCRVQDVRVWSALALTAASLMVQVVGVITRKDIAEANAKLALGRKANLGLTTPSEQLVRAGTLPFIPYGAYDPTVGRSANQLSFLEEPGASPLSAASYCFDCSPLVHQRNGPATYVPHRASRCCRF